MAEESVTIRGSKGLQLRLKKVKEALSDKKMFDQIGALLKANILVRTSKGLDAEGNEFDPYSTPYAKLRDKKGLPTEHVDLFFSGQMLSAMTYEAKDDRVTLFFLDTPRSSKTKKKSDGEATTVGGGTNAAIAFFVNEQRQFFAMSSKDLKDAEGIVQEFVRKALEGGKINGT